MEEQNLRENPAPAGRLRFLILVGFFGLCLLGGGAARSDVYSLFYLRPAALICIAALLLTRGAWQFRQFRTLFILFSAFAATIAMQLLPLHPDLWLTLPGRARYVEAAEAAGMSQPWRPLSLTPDLTLNSLLALLPPLAMLVGLAAIRPDQRNALSIALLVAAGLSVLLALAQLSSGPYSALYLYHVTHNGSAVGFFANRNHQAALLAMAFPLLRVWTLSPTRDRQYERVRLWVALGIGFFLVPMLLVTASRAGVALGLLGVFAALFLIAPPPIRPGGGRKRLRGLTIFAVSLLPVALVIAAVSLGRAEAFDRLVRLLENYGDEPRFEYWPVTSRIAADFFPFGSGFGSFDPVFRGYEQDWMLQSRYFNHAHNDALELVLTGGLPAALVLGAFIVWMVRRAVPAFRSYRDCSPQLLLARAGAIIIVILFLGSLVDYPLRTPFLGVVFVIACGWLAHESLPAQRSVPKHNSGLEVRTQ